MTEKNEFVYDLIFDRICRVALRGEKDLCLETAEGRLFAERLEVFSDNYEELPECDSFDWKRKPAEPVQETTGKTYIKLWLNQQSGHVSITDAESNIELVGCDELKHDGTKFYLVAK